MAQTESTVHYDFVIIGGGIAGVTCCEQLISIYNDKQQQKTVALISVHPLLKSVSKLQKVSQHLMDIEVAEYSSQQFQDKHKAHNNYVKLSIIRGYVTNLETSQRTVSYKTIHHQIECISFTKCLIATGGSPKLFYINNTHKKHALIHALRDSETVENFSKVLSSSHCSSIMIVGNGGISMELVYTLLQHQRATDRKLQILWIIKHSHIGNTFLDEASSAFLIPTLFPAHDPVIGKQRVQNMKAYDNIDSSAQTKDDNENTDSMDKHGGAVGPRWIGNLSKAAKQKPLWMEHTETESKDNEQHKDNDAESEHKHEFPNELILKMNCDVSSIEEYESKDKEEEGKLQLKVLLTNGESLVVDQLLCAMGVLPNTAFCDAHVFQMTDHGELVVNEYLQTNVENVYCCGDCCKVSKSAEETEDAWFQMKLWSQSQQQGWIAAHSMSCEDMEEIENNIHLQFNFELFGHITKFFGKKCVFLGKYNVKQDEQKGIRILMRVKPNEEFVKVVVKKGRVIGAVLIGETEMEETMENLILNKTDIACYGDDFLKFNVDLEAMFD